MGVETEGPSVREDFAAAGFVVSDPEMESQLIGQMHEKYESLTSHSETGSQKMDRSIFEDFISESFNEICSGYGCSRVIFNIEKSDGKIDISALPGG
jgi:hypothetical protein